MLFISECCRIKWAEELTVLVLQAIAGPEDYTDPHQQSNGYSICKEVLEDNQSWSRQPLQNRNCDHKIQGLPAKAGYGQKENAPPHQCNKSAMQKPESIQMVSKPHSGSPSFLSHESAEKKIRPAKSHSTSLEEMPAWLKEKMDSIKELPRFKPVSSFDSVFTPHLAHDPPAGQAPQRYHQACTQQGPLRELASLPRVTQQRNKRTHAASVSTDDAHPDFAPQDHASWDMQQGRSQRFSDPSFSLQSTHQQNTQDGYGCHSQLPILRDGADDSAQRRSDAIAHMPDYDGREVNLTWQGSTEMIQHSHINQPALNETLWEEEGHQDSQQSTAKEVSSSLPLSAGIQYQNSKPKACLGYGRCIF